MNETQSTPPLHPEKLLHTKLMPPRLHTAVIPRNDLPARLDAGLTRKLTLVTAPTGYGKTTLVNLWLAARKIPSAWLTLDEYDNDPVRFWTYVVSALRTLDPTLGKTTLSVLAAAQPVPFQSFLTTLINDLGVLDKSCVLVLEDYHAITSNEINDAFSFLLQHLPPSLHLLLISRDEPALPLGILRARDELVELDTTQLRFSPAETEAFLRETVNQELPAPVAAQLQERTQGWPAGLRLAARSLQDKSVAEAEKIIQSFSGSHRYVADYLINEVFENQAVPVQNFLLKTCFLDRLTGSLCDAVTGESGGTAVLAQLGRGNLFLTQLETGGERIWYRYNPLFAESIQYLARRRLGDEVVPAILEKASAWYEVHGRTNEAIETALTARLFQRAIRLIEKFIDIHDLTELYTLGRWLESLPEAEIFLHPEVCFTYAQVILYSSSDRFVPKTAVRLQPFLSSAENIWQEQKNQQKLGRLHSFQGIVAWWQGDLQKTFLYAHQSLAELAENDLFWRGNSLILISYEALSAGRILQAQDTILEARALLGAAQNIYGVLAALQLLSEAFYWQGELAQAEQLNQQILTEAVGDESMLDDQGIACLSLANIAYEQNDLDQAGQFAGRALDLTQQRGNEIFQARAVIRQATIDAAGNDFQRAGEQLKSLVSGMQNPVLLPEIQEAQAHLSLLSGDLQALAGWEALISADKASRAAVQKEREIFTLARLRIAEGKAGQALELLQDWAADAAENGRIRSQVTALCLEALAQNASSNPSQAAKSLSAALEIGQAKGFRRLFLDEGTRLAALLQTLLPMLTQRRLSLYATTLLHSFNPELAASPHASPLVEPLSQQELRALRLLVAGLSNREIAEELVVSINTVKTHLKSIYGKLNVNSREEAREVARELHLS